MSEYEKSRILNLDLLYPAVLGSLLFMMFLRFANQGWLAFSEAGTWLGVVVAVFFSIGFLNAKLDSNYGLSDSLMDLLSSIIVFLAYFLLNFAELDASKTDDSNISFGHVYWICMATSETLIAIPARIKQLPQAKLQTFQSTNACFVQPFVSPLKLLLE